MWGDAKCYVVLYNYGNCFVMMWSGGLWNDVKCCVALMNYSECFAVLWIDGKCCTVLGCEGILCCWEVILSSLQYYRMMLSALLYWGVLAIVVLCC